MDESLNNNSIEVYLENSLKNRSHKLFTYLDFDPHFVFTDTLNISNKELELFSEKIYDAGYGLEPDIRYSKFLAAASDYLVVFKASFIPPILSFEYKYKYIVVFITSLFTAYDGDVHQQEILEINSFIDSCHMLKGYERERLKASVELLTKRPYDKEQLHHFINKIPKYKNHEVIEIIFKLILADNYIDPREVALLRRVYEMLQIDSTTPKRDLMRYAKDKRIMYIDKKDKVDELEMTVKDILNNEDVDIIFDDILSDFSFS